MCLTSRPRSSTSVFNPLSQSSCAAHPPDAPEPITIASSVRFLTESTRLAIDSGINGDAARVMARRDVVIMIVHPHLLRGAGTPDGFRLDEFEQLALVFFCRLGKLEQQCRSLLQVAGRKGFSVCALGIGVECTKLLLQVVLNVFLVAPVEERR